MQLSDFVTSFKQFALYEKNLTKPYIKDIIAMVYLLEDQTDCENLKDYNTQTIAYFMQSMTEKRLWSPKTFRNYRQNLKTFFDFLIRQEYFKTNPVNAIAKPRLPKHLLRCLTKNQIQKLIAEIHTFSWTYPLEHWRNMAIIFMFFYTGIRMSELLNLKNQDINFEESEFYVRQGKGSKDRTVPLHPKLVPILKFYLGKRNERLPVSSYLFTSVRSCKALTPKNLYAIFKKLSIKCGFKMTPHMLRHTFAKLSLEANLNPYDLKTILGHSHISTTEIYMSMDNENIKRNFNKTELF
ncbi:MAG: tyrosine-type recombinase/integrase [Flavobacteriaceae bacterium]|nr:MAG: tyrosine-type recombinase/integrase [Flavobacteriaceae bacterium]